VSVTLLILNSMWMAQASSSSAEQLLLLQIQEITGARTAVQQRVLLARRQIGITIDLLSSSNHIINGLSDWSLLLLFSL